MRKVFILKPIIKVRINRDLYDVKCNCIVLDLNVNDSISKIECRSLNDGELTSTINKARVFCKIISSEDAMDYIWNNHWNTFGQAFLNWVKSEVKQNGIISDEICKYVSDKVKIDNAMVTKNNNNKSIIINI